MIHDARTCDELEETADADESRTPAFGQPRIEAAVREILLAIGEDPDREGLMDTSRRVAGAYGEMFAGLGESPARHLARQFPQDGSAP